MAMRSFFSRLCHSPIPRRAAVTLGLWSRWLAAVPPSAARSMTRTTMKLKTVTLLAAITQLLAAICGIFSYVRLAQKLKWAGNGEWFVTEPIYLVGQIMMVVFLFVLFARQKSN